MKIDEKEEYIPQTLLTMEVPNLLFVPPRPICRLQRFSLWLTEVIIFRNGVVTLSSWAWKRSNTSTGTQIQCLQSCALHHHHLQLFAHFSLSSTYTNSVINQNSFFAQSNQKPIFHNLMIPFCFRVFSYLSFFYRPA